MKNLEYFHLGAVRVEPLRNLICRQGEEIRIEPQAMRVLEYLVAQAGQVCTRDALLADVWSDTIISDGALAKAICTLRKALGDSARNPVFIETIPRTGYRLMIEPDYQPREERVFTPAAERPPASSDERKRSTRGFNYSRLQGIPNQAALLTLFLVVSGIFAVLLVSSASQKEQVTVLETVYVTEDGRIDSMVVIRTDLLEERKPLSLMGWNSAHMDSTIEIEEIKYLP